MVPPSARHADRSLSFFPTVGPAGRPAAGPRPDAGGGGYLMGEAHSDNMDEALGPPPAMAEKAEELTPMPSQ